jgi:hypothetical protein
MQGHAPENRAGIDRLSRLIPENCAAFRQIANAVAEAGMAAVCPRISRATERDFLVTRGLAAPQASRSMALKTVDYQRFKETWMPREHYNLCLVVF